MKKIKLIVLAPLASLIVVACAQTKKVPGSQAGESIRVDEKLRAAEQQVTALQGSNERLRRENASLQSELRTLRVEQFLGLQDTSIFKSRFVSVDTLSLSPRNREFYNLVRNIHDLDSVLNTKVNSPSIAEQLGMIRRNAAVAEGILDRIIMSDGKVRSWLSARQKDYFDQLVDQYNKLIEDLHEN